MASNLMWLLFVMLGLGVLAIWFENRSEREIPLDQLREQARLSAHKSEHSKKVARAELQDSARQRARKDLSKWTKAIARACEAEETSVWITYKLEGGSRSDISGIDAYDLIMETSREFKVTYVQEL